MTTATESRLIGTLADDTSLTVKNDGAPIPLAALRAAAIHLVWDGTGFRAHHKSLPADHAHYLMAGRDRATAVQLVDGRVVELVRGGAYVMQYSHTVGWVVDQT